MEAEVFFAEGFLFLTSVEFFLQTIETFTDLITLKHFKLNFNGHITMVKMHTTVQILYRESRDELFR